MLRNTQDHRSTVKCVQTPWLYKFFSPWQTRPASGCSSNMSLWVLQGRYQVLRVGRICPPRKELRPNWESLLFLGKCEQGKAEWNPKSRARIEPGRIRKLTLKPATRQTRQVCSELKDQGTGTIVVKKRHKKSYFYCCICLEDQTLN